MIVQENRVAHLQEHLRWEAGFAGQVVARAAADGYVARSRGDFALTDAGRTLARNALAQT